MRLSKRLSIKNFVFITITIIALWQIHSGVYIYAKAYVAQILLENAWSKTLKGNKSVKPWNWADTYPIAKIKFDEFNKEFIVLAGGSGRTMAFGPGHVSATPLPGHSGNSVIVGHRDTHFSVLQNVNVGSVIVIEMPTRNLRYKVVHRFVVDQSEIEVMSDLGEEFLTLITCYPFNTLQVGGPLRYVVQASPI